MTVRSCVKIFTTFIITASVTSALIHTMGRMIRSTRLCSSAASQFAQAQAAQRQAIREEEAQRRYHSHLERLGDETDVVPGSVADPQKWLQFAGIVGVRMLQLSLIHAYGIIFTSSILHS